MGLNLLKDRAALNSALADYLVRLVGLKRITRKFWHRWIASGADYSEIEETLSGVRSLAQWPLAWSRLGERYLGLAERARAEGGEASAHDFFLKASVYYYLAQWAVFENGPVKEQAYALSKRSFLLAGEGMRPPVEEVRVSLGQESYPAYLRVPAGEGKRPCAVFVHGMDSAKEEVYWTERQACARGFASLVFDGPGQGETYIQAKRGWDEDFERVVMAALDLAAAQPRVDARRLYLVGLSWGGFWALKTAALDPRVRAGISIGGPPSSDHFDRLPLPIRKRFEMLLDVGPVKGPRARRLIAKMDLGSLVEDIRCPLLVVHGRKDPLVPFGLVEGMVGRLRCPVDFRIYDDGDHCCTQHAAELRHLAADWLLQRDRDGLAACA